MAETKQFYRQQALARLQALNDEARAVYAQLMTKQMTERPEWQAAKVVALSLAQDDELPTQLLIQVALIQHKQVVLPKVRPQHQMDFIPVDAETVYERHKFGMLEPVGDPLHDLKAIDVVVVPGLAFAADGARLGFGGGYYDRWLPKVEAPTFGFTIPENYYQTAAWPTETTDQPVDHVLVLKGNQIDDRD
ncbi:5-formyltetrahydrofolate cyclo-ligase [Weissella uvarum]|uniref:5-formyltetrahydrofolate cyclo-ligase n=1 Tax=Weissella uvarum TaxID=1479233 RepID=UPI0019610086|nr:5-formyltetrahydrofolate cyclo-ligase [Weissella uvarum]MBM7616637.1 5-formyltetrahydrofolate cyclo-ligase [Weissella uvarum]MCM0594905.1 5-formyltetrahydrofolate cyclo-ligase [Weissella uvarum]